MKLVVFPFLTLLGVLLTGTGWVWALDLKPVLESTGFTLKQWFAFYVLWGVMSGLVAGFLSRDISIWSTDTRILEDEDKDHPLFQKVLKLAHERRLNWVPLIGIYPSEDVNLFSAGPFPKRSVISVSEGFLKLNEDDQESFLNAELNKIENLDTALLVFCHGITHGFVLYIARILAFLLGTSFRQTEGHSSSTYPEILVSGLATVFLTFWGSALVYVLARTRNLKGDALIQKRYGQERKSRAMQSLQVGQRTEAYDLFTKFLKVSFPAR